MATNFALAPPVKVVDGLTAVPMDIQRITASLVFDGATQTGTGDATLSGIFRVIRTHLHPATTTPFHAFCALSGPVGKGTLRREDFKTDKKRVRILSLTDNTPYILAWGNDEGFDRVFVEQLKNLASAGDLLIAISGSGNSPNILKAVEWANRNKLVTFGCTGFGGGKLRSLAHHNLHVPLDDMGIVESIHLTAFHWVVDDLHRRISM